jgi:hypothetical protein
MFAISNCVDLVGHKIVNIWLMQKIQLHLKDKNQERIGINNGIDNKKQVIAKFLQ